jgi:hypothetical protein
LLGRTLLSSRAPQAALAHYRDAVDALERLRGQVMLEYRSGFLQERETVYNELVSLCLDLSDPLLALEYAERSKSQSLLDLLSGKVDLGIRARDPADEPLVEQIERLRSERQLYARRLDYLWLDVAPRSDQESAQLRERILAIEKGITELWHQLLIRNTSYEGDAVIWETGLWDELSAPLRLDLLEEDALLLEYFPVDDGLALFLAHPASSPSGESVQAMRLPVRLPKIEMLLQALLLNLRSVPQSIQIGGPGVGVALEKNARALLSRLYEALLGPIAEEIVGASRLVIVPHGSLHYLPFHALYNGESYLIETHALRYLPAAAFLRLGKEKCSAQCQILAVGHSFGGRLPYTLEEASEVAKLWNTQPLLEKSATSERVRETLGEYDLLHLACHGDFRPDNPLFSGLALEDGWITTLDLFNIRMRASLVTLSACQTGRSVVGGGDELSGLMRACLSAGAATLALSLWPVADRSAAMIMEHFYRALACGEDKASSLRQAQLSLLRGEGETDPYYRHPYFWAPFYLVGDGGYL